MKKNISKLIFTVIAYALVILLITYISFTMLLRSELNSIDDKLTQAAFATQAILGQDFHDQLVDEQSLSSDQDRRIAIKLYDFARQIGIAYLYSFKKFNDEILFVVSSATDEELALDTYNPAYYTKYPEMDAAIALAFETGIKQFANYNDRWGSFRSVFIPFKTDTDEIYVIGVDIKEEQVTRVLNKSLLYSLFVAGLMTLFFLPVFYLLIKSKNDKLKLKNRLLYVDHLTGLPNRNQILKDLPQVKYTNLALIDIKRFSDVINSYGPAIGDHLLKKFAVRLNNFKHPNLKNFQAYRLDRDVFAVIENQNLEVKELRRGTEELIKYLTSIDYKLSETESIKVEVTLGGVNQNEDAYMLANMALDEAKRQKVQSFLYDTNSDHLPQTYKKITSIKKQIDEALIEDRLIPYYQPIFCSKDFSIKKYECLARIVNSEGELKGYPAEFIPVAKRVGSYHEITRRIVTKSIDEAREHDRIISINLSISDIMDPKTSSHILNAVTHALNPEKVQFEILETEAVINLSHVRAFILNLQKLNAKVGIDDLGRSYSNFDRLTNLPFDFVKIDGAIVTAIVNDVETQQITRDIIILAKRHHMKVTAEYCINEEVTKMAVRLGVDYLQGFYLGKPARKPWDSTFLPQ